MLHVGEDGVVILVQPVKVAPGIVHNTGSHRCRIKALHTRLYRVKERVGRLARNSVGKAAVWAKAVNQRLGCCSGALVHIGANADAGAAYMFDGVEVADASPVASMKIWPRMARRPSLLSTSTAQIRPSSTTDSTAVRLQITRTPASRSIFQ